MNLYASPNNHNRNILAEFMKHPEITSLNQKTDQEKRLAMIQKVENKAIEKAAQAAYINKFR